MLVNTSKMMAKNFAVFLFLVLFLLDHTYCDGTTKSSSSTANFRSTSPTAPTPESVATSGSATTRVRTTRPTRGPTVITLPPQSTTNRFHTITIPVNISTTEPTIATTSNSTGNITETTTSNSTGNITETTTSSNTTSGNTTSTTPSSNSTTVVTTVNPSTTPSPSSGGLSAGVIVLIVLGTLLGVTLIVGAIFLYVRRRRQKMLENERQGLVVNNDVMVN